MTEERQEESLLRNKHVQQTHLSSSSEEPSLTREEEMTEKKNIPFSDVYLSSNRLHSHVVHDTKWPPPEVPDLNELSHHSSYLLSARYVSSLPGSSRHLLPCYKLTGQFLQTCGSHTGSRHDGRTRTARLSGSYLLCTDGEGVSWDKSKSNQFYKLRFHILKSVFHCTSHTGTMEGGRLHSM